jgi:hypothetical protein
MISTMPCGEFSVLGDITGFSVYSTFVKGYSYCFILKEYLQLDLASHHFRADCLAFTSRNIGLLPFVHNRRYGLLQNLTCPILIEGSGRRHHEGC